MILPFDTGDFMETSESSVVEGILDNWYHDGEFGFKRCARREQCNIKVDVFKCLPINT